jgi:hypothetical protein
VLIIILSTLALLRRDTPGTFFATPQSSRRSFLLNVLGLVAAAAGAAAYSDFLVERNRQPE